MLRSAAGHHWVYIDALEVTIGHFQAQIWSGPSLSGLGPLQEKSRGFSGAKGVCMDSFRSKFALENARL